MRFIPNLNKEDYEKLKNNLSESLKQDISNLLLETNIKNINFILEKSKKVYEYIKTVFLAWIKFGDNDSIKWNQKTGIFEIKGVEHNIPDIWITPQFKDEIASYNIKRNIITLALLDDNHKLSISKVKDLLADKYEKNIMHELTHFFDISHLKAKCELTKINSDYNNDKFEIKAYTNELIHENINLFNLAMIMRMASGMDPLEAFKNVINTILNETFKQNHSAANIYYNMSKYNQKKVYKDFYNYFLDIFEKNFAKYSPSVFIKVKSNVLLNYNHWLKTHK